LGKERRGSVEVLDREGDDPADAVDVLGTARPALDRRGPPLPVGPDAHAAEHRAIGAVERLGSRRVGLVRTGGSGVGPWHGGSSLNNGASWLRPWGTARPVG
jgi:hypothetical protein